MTTLARVAIYARTRLLGDLSGGMTAAIVALPIALAFGVASGLGAEVGLYGAIAAGIVAALFGGTPGQATGPTGPMTVIVAAIVAAHPNVPGFIFAAVLLAGLLQIVFGLTRLGRFIHYMPYPVVSGFMSGVGVIIILLQLAPLLGGRASSHPLEALSALPGQIAHANPVALAVGLGVIALIALLPRLNAQLPASLIALILATGAVAYAHLAVPLLGAIPGGLPHPAFPAFSLRDFQALLPAAFSLAALGAIDSLLTSLVVDRLSRQHHDSNRELMGQGLGNVACALIGGLPGAGATMRSVVNLRSGGKTRLSGAFHGAILLAALLGLGPWAAKIPLAALAGVLLMVGVSIIDYRGLASLRHAAKSDGLVMLTTLGLTVFVDLIAAVAVGLALAGVLFSKKLSDAKPASHGVLESLSHLEGVIDQVPVEARQRIYVYTFNTPLYFATTRSFSEAMARLPDVRAVILQFLNAPLIDQSGAFALEDALERLTEKGAQVALVGLNDELAQALGAMGVWRRLPGGSWQSVAFDSLDAALERLAVDVVA